MKPLYSVNIPTNYGEKPISVFHQDVIVFEEQIDILTASAFSRSYIPTPKTLFRALGAINISAEDLARNPEFDLRDNCNVWLSREIINGTHIKRLGCIEMTHDFYNYDGFTSIEVNEHEMLKSLKVYFQLLDIAATCGIKMDTVALPFLGSGNQQIAENLIAIPLLNECVEFLKRNSAVKRIYFIETNMEKAYRLAQVLAKSYSFQMIQKSATSTTCTQLKDVMAFISYSSCDRNIADNLCAKLEAKGIKVWYAPRNVNKAYASAIAEAIMSATHFIVVLSKNSMSSEHVLNEIDLAFQKLPNDIKFHPLRIDEHEFPGAFNYYLSRQHWMDAIIPPIEIRLNEFVNHLMETI